jgi:hypothetical protein
MKEHSMSAASEDTHLVDDPAFMNALERLRQLCAFSLQAAAGHTQPHSACLLGELNRLHSARLSRGRRATRAEWEEVEQRTHALWLSLTECQRRRFLGTQIPAWVATLIPLLLVAALAALLFAYLVTTKVLANLPAQTLVPFMVWTTACGAIGAAASVGMNALSVQDDATFDISSARLTILRLVIGALFGTVLTLPLGFSTFVEFLESVALTAGDGPAVTAVKNVEDRIAQTSMLLLPFVLGFSTSLVILLINRFMDAVQSLFGKRTGERRRDDELLAHGDRPAHREDADRGGDPIGKLALLHQAGSSSGESDKKTPTPAAA